MFLRVMSFTTLVCGALAQTPARHSESQPLYRVTVVQRTTPAINYGHRSAPTKIDFKGTPLIPQSHGEATVEEKRGAVTIDAKFQDVPPPTRFGSGYLTYVLWAISPEGRAQNLGELVLNASDKGRVIASTQMQAFALIVTAEPYFSVSQPSDVVVLENAIRPDTVGRVEQVNATYELLPRKEYTYTVPTQNATAPTGGPALSMGEYEAVLATYQAQNAIQIARAAGAERYAAGQLTRAQQLLDQARVTPRKELGAEVVTLAREAAQIAEDARIIATQRSQADQLAQEHAQTREVRKEAAAEEAASEQARADAERAQAEAARAAAAASQARQQLEAQQEMEARPPAPPAASADRMRAPSPSISHDARLRLLHQLNAAFPTLDTPRGLVMTIPASLLRDPSGIQSARSRLGSAVRALLAIPGLRYEVDGHTDTGSSEAARLSASQSLAGTVRDVLVSAGIPQSAITARAFGNSRPVAPTNSAAGREQNRRVEIVVTGEAIGQLPTWERTYSLQP